MPNLETRLIDAAVRPLADNAEMKLSATRLLETLSSASDPGGEMAIRRWDLIDSRRRKPVIRIALFCILAVVSAAVLAASIRQAIGYQKIASWFMWDFSGAVPELEPETLIGGNLTGDQKLLLFGRSSASSKEARAKPLWDSEPDNPAYFASKAGLLGLTRCVALEGAAHGVTCAMISPTWVETELMRRNVAQVVAREGKGRTVEQAMAEIAQGNPQQRLIQPQEIAALALFLCGDAARGITMENIQITGGALW